MTHLDREVEVIQLKYDLELALKALANSRSTTIGDFGTRSCEQIAEHLMLSLGLSRCMVLEDGENGAEVFA